MNVDSIVKKWVEKHINIIEEHDYRKLCAAIAQELTTTTCTRLFDVFRKIEYVIPEEYRWEQVKNMVDRIINMYRQTDETYISDTNIITTMMNLVGFRTFEISQYLDKYNNKYAVRCVTNQGKGFTMKCS